MGDADEFHPTAERNEGVPVLKPDRARGAEARYAETWQFVEENAAIRVDSAFWHGLCGSAYASMMRYLYTLPH
jgi:hypothetical protein